MSLRFGTRNGGARRLHELLEISLVLSRRTRSVTPPEPSKATKEAGKLKQPSKQERENVEKDVRTVALNHDFASPEGQNK